MCVRVCVEEGPPKSLTSNYFSRARSLPLRRSPTTNGRSPVACTVCGLPAIEAELALVVVLEFEPPLERPLCGLTGVGRYTICQAQ